MGARAPAFSLAKGAMAGKVTMRPDFLIKQRIAQDNSYAAASAYNRKMEAIKQNTGWFESKIKYEFADGEKRSQAFVRQEMQCANNELKLRRRVRLQLLYENEARAYEEELSSLGLAIQRQRH